MPCSEDAVLSTAEITVILLMSKTITRNKLIVFFDIMPHFDLIWFSNLLFVYIISHININSI